MGEKSLLDPALTGTERVADAKSPEDLAEAACQIN